MLISASCKKKHYAIGTNSTISNQEGLSTNFITVNSVVGKYLIYRPVGLIKSNALITILHGGGGAGVDVAQVGAHPLSEFRTIADSAKIPLAYPEGSTDIQGNPGWNDCRSDDYAGSQVDDIDFLKQPNTKLSSELNLNAEKMFLTGTSNGALMTFSYAFQFPETIKAIAVSSGNLPQFPESGICTTGSTTPLPILLTHGTSDPAMPANGGCVTNLGGACNRGTVLSQTKTIDHWINRNNLNSVMPSTTKCNVNLADAGDVEKRIYIGAAPIVYFILNNAGHAVPAKQFLVHHPSQWYSK
ncbi:alpha/beta hydrolase family esterase [Flavobacterium macrobrachii]|uniref:Phospholipase/carboxylesterase/thioesterase domain-containing protein n=1 Tax=Flavobacterium macrobrachii TaxID=591204 RepID=A0ABS2CTF9_9FLAO|nr:hypothetical protein [Flavobacterium macrobrachii]MBM6498246.1 hypothetical protein [Flavobacterium macrobrachii]